jgi:hypothetical protein
VPGGHDGSQVEPVVLKAGLLHAASLPSNEQAQVTSAHVLGTSSVVSVATLTSALDAEQVTL